MMLGPRETRALLERHGLRPKTSIGQHFVTDPNTIRKVVSLAGLARGDLVLEVGPGIGSLSLGILERGARLIAVEVDRALEPVLAEVLEGSNARVVIGDAMHIDVKKLLRGRPTKLVANLPYQIATPLVLDLLAGVPAIQSFTVMVQKEVGERLAARPGDDAYGAVSAKIAFLASARIAGRVSRRVFYPMPDVESVIVQIDRRARPAERIAQPRLFAVIEAGFAQRRKTIRRALRGAGWDAAEVERVLDRAGVAPEARAETLGVPQFAAIARALPVKR
ncbi:MAG: 16S rRNA (adenine(1518)-N(6)/adenine(1519)-N(6))-dimethyltransferase RsmA [Actinobacteria bacterium]|nr:MAG: 16S rRNA (adenine(1518)-N(6)/adenine(1519)-N(6))-dimethyltransferase RsmA [Actinomycetota bacterium]